MEKLGLTDRPVSSLAEESLGVKDYMEALSKFIVTCETPMTISIQADWGAGKTSMMNLVKSKLEDEQIDTIWFNTWQFSQFNMGDDLPISLLGQFAKKFDVEESSNIKKSLNFLKKSARIATTTVADKVVSGSGKVVDALFDESSKDSSETIIELKRELHRSVQNKIDKSSSDRVVIFIDDLDRLVPEKAVELLETMKLFLDIPGCVFVLAIDYNVVVKGLEKKFGVSVDDAKGKSFFDKIIQLPFNLPVAQYDLGKYFKELLHGKFEYKDDDIDTFVKLANNSVGFNPRSMKRLFNSLQLLKMVAATKKILDADSIATAYEKQRILFAILCLQTAYESMYRFMLKHQSKIDQDFFDTFSELEKLKESEYYHEVKKELAIKEDEDDKLIRFIEFINTFYEAIQLDSDDSEDADDNLSEKELENLMRFLSFSSITTSNSRGLNASSGVFQFKSNMLPFLNDLLVPKFKENIESMESELSISSNNKSGNIYFTFRQGSMDINCVAYRDDKEVVLRLDYNSGNKDTVHKWFQKYLLEKYPDMRYKKKSKYAFLILKKYKYSDEILENENAKVDIYKDLTLKFFEDIMPPLSKHYSEVKPIVDSLKVFVNKLLIELKSNFSSEDGWYVDVGNTLNFGLNDSINIYHNSWRKNSFVLSLHPASSMFRKLYFGIKKVDKKLKLNVQLKESILENFQRDFDGGGSDALWVWTSALQKYNNTISGEPYYEKTGKYNYESNEEESTAIAYMVEQMKRMQGYKDKIKELSFADA